MTDDDKDFTLESHEDGDERLERNTGYARILAQSMLKDIFPLDENKLTLPKKGSVSEEDIAASLRDQLKLVMIENLGNENIDLTPLVAFLKSKEEVANKRAKFLFSAFYDVALQTEDDQAKENAKKLTEDPSLRELLVNETQYRTKQELYDIHQRISSINNLQTGDSNSFQLLRELNNCWDKLDKMTYLAPASNIPTISNFRQKIHEAVNRLPEPEGTGSVNKARIAMLKNRAIHDQSSMSANSNVSGRGRDG